MDIRYEPFSEAARLDPYPFYKALREHAPIYWAEGARAWVVSRYDDVHHVLTQPELFSSDAMRTVFMTEQQSPTNLDPAKIERLLAIAQALPFSPEEMIAARNMIAIDPPEHEKLRKIVSRGFTPRRIAAYESKVREIVGGCMRKLRADGRFDLVADLAIPVPTLIIAQMLGVEPERYEDFRRWSDSVISNSTGSGRGRSPLETGYVENIAELTHYLVSIVEARRKRPSEDLVSVLIAAEDGEAGLSALEVVTFTILLLVAGNETTTNLIGNAVHALLEHPDQMRLIERNRALVPNLVEETLRYDGPIQFLVRRARRDTEIAGTRIGADDIVMPVLASANRDERRFERSEQFDITRDTSGHLAFGFGVHYCLGSALARLEAGIALDAIVQELPRLRRCRPEVEPIDSYLIRGLRRLELMRAA
jgi:cytochrome P450